MKYNSQYKQLTLDAFRSSLDGLDKANRWVMLGDMLPWDKIERLYNSKLNNETCGAGNKSARMVIGALIIKHKMRLSDEETILAIQENPYMQYMVGLSEFTDKKIFDPSLFVTIRKRLGIEDCNEMSVELLREQLRLEEEKRRSESEGKNDDCQDSGVDCTPESSAEQESSETEYTDSKGRKHKGVLKIDATCADAEVRYPVDVDIIHDGCRVLNDYLHKICSQFDLGKPRTEYKYVRRIYLELIKKKSKTGKAVKNTISVMLSSLRKDMLRIMKILASDGARYEFLHSYEQRTLTAIIKMYHQQTEMLDLGVHHCEDRIVSIFQPHLRPIVRGKAKAKTEFGAKIGASIVDGYTFIDHHSWDAYSEESDLSLQIELFKERFGYLPAVLDADKIYMNRSNRDKLKDLEIKAYCTPLGRPPKEASTPEYKAKMAKAIGDRNEIEATFGTGKRIYGANNIRAKLKETAECWTGMCYFVKNVMKFLRELCHVLTLIWLYIVNFIIWQKTVRTPALVKINFSAYPKYLVNLDDTGSANK